MRLETVLSGIPLTRSALSKEYWQNDNSEHNLLKYMGGMGPYVQGHGYGLEYDENAFDVEQVFIFARHGERYPTTSLNNDLRKTFDKLKGAQVDNYVGPMSFVKDWTYFVEDDSLLEQETNTSCFSGLQDMYNFGAEIRRKYGNLIDDEATVPLFASGSKRVCDSATAFGKGFGKGFDNDQNQYKLIILPEKRSQGANTLTSGRSCKPYHKKQGYTQKYIAKTLVEESKRLNRESPGFNVTSEDVTNLIRYCAFELNAKGSSEVCNALSMDAFIEHEYMRDTELYYTKANHPLTFTLGSVYVNATLQLLSENPAEHQNQRVWVSFSHDTDLLYFMNAIGILENQQTALPTDSVAFARFFRTSELVPMGARIVIEQLVDKTNGEKIVRILVNDAVIPLQNCQDGPLFTCRLSTLRHMFYEKLRKNGSFSKRCEVKSGRPEYLSFYWDWVDGKY
ncbi:hypothetical protein HII13_002559 [Brettanomyces bruxellensis]|nr:hypothetical protein HII13_002559 [Brettanomyces bruxellensis]